MRAATGRLLRLAHELARAQRPARVGGARRRGALRGDRRRGRRGLPRLRRGRARARRVRRARDRPRSRRLSLACRPCGGGQRGRVRAESASCSSSTRAAARSRPLWPRRCRRAASCSRCSSSASRTTTSSRSIRSSSATVADLLGASLANALGPDDSDGERRLDALTGLPNHRAFHDELDAAAPRRRSRTAARSRSSCSTSTTSARSSTSAGVRPATRRCARSRTPPARSRGAEAFRIGGDEFALLLRGGLRRGRSSPARPSRTRSRRRPAAVASVSAGVAAFPADARTKDELVHQADLALLRGEARRPNARRRVLLRAAGRRRPLERRGAPRASCTA